MGLNIHSPFRVYIATIFLSNAEARFNAERINLSSAERASIAFGWSPANAGDRLPHRFCGKPAPLAEDEMFRRVSACKAVCAALREGEGSGATLRIKPLLTAVWSRIRLGTLTNEVKNCPFDFGTR